MQTLSKPLPLAELKALAENGFGDMVKAVVDIERELVAVDAELHSDLEALLLEQGATQGKLWGINFYPDLAGDDFIEFDSMINVRPASGNRSRGVEDISIQKDHRDLQSLGASVNLQHKDLASGRWAQMPFAEQMANVGSEVERALNWREKQNDPYAEKALLRAIELVGLTVDSTRSFPRLRELTRMREALLDFFLGPNDFRSSAASFRKYFLGFACLARKGK